MKQTAILTSIFKKMILSLFILFFVFSKSSATVKAAPPLSLKLPIFTETQHLDLPKNSASFWFSIPGDSILADSCSLNLHISASDTLIDERSSLTLSVNDTALTTFHIMDIIEAENGIVQTEIPAKLLRTDSMNELKIITAQRSIEGDCADIDNPANWVNLHEDSYLLLKIADCGKPLLSGYYNGFYHSPVNPDSIRHSFILANPSSSAQLDSLLKLSSAAGENAPYQTKLAGSVSFSENKSAAGNRIYIGLLEEWEAIPMELPASLSGPEGYLAITGDGLQNSLLVSGASDEGLIKAADFAQDNQYLNQLETSSQIIATSVPERKSLPVFKQDGYYTLSDFGYESAHLAGAFHQQVSYQIAQPKGLKAKDRSYAELHFKHSKALAADHSLLTVYIDGIPQGSAKLSSSNADEGILKVSIPSGALEKESFTLSIACYNYLGRVDCSKDYYDTAWTLIEDSSVIYLEPGDEGFRPALSGFPSFPATKESANVTIVLPEEVTETDAALASMLSTRAGQNSPAGLLWDTALGCENLTDDQKQHNLILFGHLAEDKLPPEIAKELPILPTTEGTYQLRDSIKITAEALSQKLILQSIRSPYDYDRRIYVLLYAPDLSAKEGAALLAHMLSDKTYLNRLNGHAALTADGESFTTFMLEEEGGRTQSIPLTPERAVYLLETYTGVSLWGLILIAALLILVIVLTSKILKDKNRFSKAASRMQLENEASHDSDDES